MSQRHGEAGIPRPGTGGGAIVGANHVPSFAPVGTDLPEDLVELRDYQLVLEVFRSQSFKTELRDGTDAVRRDTVLRLNGPEHPRRRRSLNRVVQHQNARWFVDAFLVPALESELRKLDGMRGEAGEVSADLTSLIPDITIRLALAMIGLDVSGDSDVRELTDLAQAFREMAGVRWIVDPATKAAVLSRAVESKERFEQYFLPALSSRRESLAREGPESSPSRHWDFLTLVAAHSDGLAHELLGKHVDPSLEDSDMAIREAMTSYIIGAVDTTTLVITWCVDELSRWFESNPADTDRLSDPQFLYEAVVETLRLHPTNPATIRIAVEDTDLSDGTQIRMGQTVALLTGVASRDEAVFGPTAEKFLPGREVPHGILPYGLAFGSGVHMCYGLPLVLGSTGTDGSLVEILAALYRAGMRPDPGHPPELMAGTYKQQFATFPVIFAPGSMRRRHQTHSGPEH
jgi:cytochrome P450